MSTANRKILGMRLEALRQHHLLTWGELAKKIGISRSMLDFLKSGEKAPGPKVMRLIVEAEREAGIIPPETDWARDQREGRESLSAMGSQDRERFHKLSLEYHDLMEQHLRLNEKLRAVQSELDSLATKSGHTTAPHKE